MPTRRLYSHFCYFDMDVEKMQQAAEYLLGEHDFKSLCNGADPGGGDSQNDL